MKNFKLIEAIIPKLQIAENLHIFWSRAPILWLNFFFQKKYHIFLELVGGIVILYKIELKILFSNGFKVFTIVPP